MGSINISFFDKKQKSLNKTEAGHIVSIKTELKRRNSDSLIWDSSAANEILFFNDSLLTLNHSSAHLSLKDQTDLIMSENTLVTLEEPDVNYGGEIRLKFSKGDLAARNPFANTQIKGDDWIVDVEKGSDISLRKNNNEYEFEIKKGNAVLKTDDGYEKLSDSQLLKLKENKEIERIEKTKKIKWNDEKPIRIYTEKTDEEINLSWTGNAKSLLITQLDKSDRVIEIEPTQQVYRKKMELGKYQIRLMDVSGISESRDVEILSSPKLYLTKPLSRDRLNTDVEQEFNWSRVDGAVKYKVKFSDGTELESVENFIKNIFTKPADINWTVEAYDKDGYRMPSKYENKIFIRDEPLSAPKIKTPVIFDQEEGVDEENKTSLPGAFNIFFKLFINQALAQTKKNEIYFEWEAVKGAEFYVIEISSDPNFRDPEVITSTSNTSYKWRRPDSKKYFWRVAGQKKNGKLGFFSEPIELKAIVKRKTVVADANKSTKTESNEALEAEVFVEPNIDEKKNEYSGILELKWIPFYKNMTAKSDAITEMRLSGGVPLSVSIQYKGAKYLFNIWYASHTWSPKPIVEYPFQKKLNIPEYRFFVLSGEYGLSLQSTILPKRVASEEIDYNLETIPGFLYSRKYFSLFAGSNGKLSEFSIDLNYRKYFKADDSGYFVEIGAKVTGGFGKEMSTQNSNLFLGIGTDAF